MPDAKKSAPRQRSQADAAIYSREFRSLADEYRVLASAPNAFRLSASRIQFIKEQRLRKKAGELVIIAVHNGFLVNRLPVLQRLVAHHTGEAPHPLHNPEIRKPDGRLLFPRCPENLFNDLSEDVLPAEFSEALDPSPFVEFCFSPNSKDAIEARAANAEHQAERFIKCCMILADLIEHDEASDGNCSGGSQKSRRKRGEANRVVARYLHDHAFERPQIGDVFDNTGVATSTIDEQVSFKRYKELIEDDADPATIKDRMQVFINPSGELERLTAEQTPSRRK